MPSEVPFACAPAFVMVVAAVVALAVAIVVLSEGGGRTSAKLLRRSSWTILDTAAEELDENESEDEFTPSA